MDISSKNLPFFFSSIARVGLCHAEGCVRKMKRLHLDIYGEEWYICPKCGTAYVLEIPNQGRTSNEARFPKGCLSLMEVDGQPFGTTYSFPTQLLSGRRAGHSQENVALLLTADHHPLGHDLLFFPCSNTHMRLSCADDLPMLPPLPKGEILLCHLWKGESLPLAYLSNDFSL